MNKIVVAQEFVKAVNPALKTSHISPTAFSEFIKTKDAEVVDGQNCTSTPTGIKSSEFQAKANVAQEMYISTKTHNQHVTFQRRYKVVYLGYAVLDRRYTLPMLPWVIAEIKRYGSQNAEEIYLEVAESALKAVNSETDKVVFEHKLQTISKFAQTAQDPACFTYMTREVVNGPCAYHVFQAGDERTVLELFTALREMTKEMQQLQSVLSPLTKSGSGMALDEIMMCGQQYEVMYLGRIKVLSKRAPPAFIDDAVEKFRLHEVEKLRYQKNCTTPSYRHRHGSGASVSSLPYNLELVEGAKENELSAQERSVVPVNRDFARISAENISVGSPESSTAIIHKSCSDPFNITALSPSCSSDSFITGISPSISTSSFSQSLEAAGKNNMLMPPSSLITHTQSLDSPACADIVQDLRDIQSCTQPVRERALSSSSSSSSVTSCPSKQTSLPAFRHRVGSGGSADMRRPRAFTSPAQPPPQQKNRTMLFLIGKLELCLIGMDKKQVLFSKTFNDIAHCSQGIKHLDHFGFICRETALAGSDFYAGYVFRCETEKVVDEIMQSLRLAFKKAHHDYQHTPQPKTPNVPKVVICEACPMQWFHRLCTDVEGLPPEEAHCVIVMKLHTLPDCDRLDVMTKCEDADVNCLQEQNEVLMMYLREFCEQRQMKHSHLNNGTCNKSDLVFLKDKASGHSKLDNFRQKAKKSLSSSFETILKRKHREEGRDRSITSISDNTALSALKDEFNESQEVTSYREGSYDGIEVARSSSPLHQRPRSSTFSTTHEVRKSGQKKSPQRKVASPQAKSPIMNIFMKIGTQNQTPYSSEDEADSPSKKGSWRQAIFHRVQTPVSTPKAVTGTSIKSVESSSSSQENLAQVPAKKSKEQLRALWKKAILEQILLIRMEKENKKLQVSQDAVSHKRMKLDYEDITPCLKDSILMWDELLNSADRPRILVEKEKLLELVKAGVPRNRRGEIWQFLAEQHNMRHPSSFTNFEQLTVPYEDLLRQLTSHQHAILIDLGRTFPNHPFYSQPLGPGQLSLFNLLKAYSLLDKEVGYCQGLSFVSGILLLHMPEEQAFQMMKHILFHLGFRRQYKPDMVALQIQMYQLSRLIHDNNRDLYDHLERYDIAPTLYAAPWFLTLFASQFPLGFVARLFDLIFLQGTETIFKVALVLLRTQKDLILQCHGFEAIMEFLKSSLPAMNAVEMQRVFNQVFTLDIGQQLHAYEVEYHVLKEEMMYSPSRSDAELVQKLEAANRTLKVQNMELMEQLQVAYSTIHNLEASEASYKSTVQRLEVRIRTLEEEKEALTHSMGVMRKRLHNLEAAACMGLDEDDERGSHPPSFQMVYAMAGSEKEEDEQLRRLIKDYREKKDLSAVPIGRDQEGKDGEMKPAEVGVTSPQPDRSGSDGFDGCGDCRQIPREFQRNCDNSRADASSGNWPCSAIKLSKPCAAEPQDGESVQNL